MATNNPLGISTAQGRGEAQVFGSTYNPYFKEELESVKAKDKEITDAMAKVSDMGELWSRDVGAFKPMVNELQQFYRDNARSLIKGDFDTTLKLKQLQNNMSQYISSSKGAEKYAKQLLLDLNKNPNKYSDTSRQRVLDFVNQSHAGDFDTSVLRLDPKYLVNKSTEAMQKAVKDLGYDLTDLRVVPKKYTDSDGAVKTMNVLVDKQGQDVKAIEDIVNQRVAGDMATFGEEQVGKVWTEDFKNEAIENLKNFINTKTKTSQVRDADYWSSGSGKRQLDAASKLKRDAGLIQNFIPGKSEAVISNLEDNGITVTHTAQSEALAKQYPGKSGILVEEGYGDKRRKYFIGTTAEDYKKLENLLRRTRLYSKVDEEALERVPGFDATEEGKQIIASQPKPLPRATEINDYTALLSDKLPELDVDKLNTLSSKLGLSKSFQQQLTNITERGLEGRDDFYNKALSGLKGKTIDLTVFDPKEFDDKDSKNAAFESIELSDDGETLRFNFDTGDYVRIPYKNNKFDVSKLIKGLMGSKSKIEVEPTSDKKELTLDPNSPIK